MCAESNAGSIILSWTKLQHSKLVARFEHAFAQKVKKREKFLKEYAECEANIDSMPTDKVLAKVALELAQVFPARDPPKTEAQSPSLHPVGLGDMFVSAPHKYLPLAYMSKLVSLTIC